MTVFTDVGEGGHLPVHGQADAEQLDAAPLGELPEVYQALADAVFKAHVRRGTQPGHRVGSFLRDLQAAGYTISRLPEHPAAPATAPTFQAAEAGGGEVAT